MRRMADADRLRAQAMEACGGSEEEGGGRAGGWLRYGVWSRFQKSYGKFLSP